ncbi:MAG: hypothetical protein KDE47_15660 [Caldilineaceae bacterium]|nr:hypothetical protein [Caldilineaceae bacterium]
MRHSVPLLCVLLLFAFHITVPTVLAHGGGTPRLTDVPVGPYQIFVWSQPEPLRAGEVHLTIGLTLGEQATPTAPAVTGQDGILAQPVTDATVHVQMIAAADPSQVIETVAVAGGLGAVYYETDASLPTAGPWRFIIDVSGDAGQGTIEFREELLAARTLNVPLLIGAVLLFIVGIGLVGVWNRRTGENHEVVKSV